MFKKKDKYAVPATPLIPPNRTLYEKTDDERSYERGYERDAKFDKMLRQTPAKKDETNPKDLLGLKKVQLDLVPASSIIYQALAMEDGATKYGAFNYREKPVKASIYVAAAMRHVMAWYDGEENATDSGKPHLAHALACLGILVDAKETGNLIDNRPYPGAAAKLIARFEKKVT